MKLLLAALFTLTSFSNPSFAAQDTFYENSSGTPLLALINNAKSSVDIEIYEMDDPLFLGEIKSAVARGVRVRVIKEDKPVGATCRVFVPKTSTDDVSCQNQKDLVGIVKKAGGSYVPFNTATLCGMSGSKCFEHGKIVVVDQREAIISTGNFNSSNLCNKAEHPKACNRDYSVTSADAIVVNTLEQIFDKDLRGTSYRVEDILNQAGNQKLTVSPFSLAPLVAFIETAKSKIEIQNQYLKDPEMNQAIIAAAARGVVVEVMVASACSFGKPTPSATSSWNSIYTSFDQAGVKSRIFTRNIRIDGVAGYLHAKAIVVDGKNAWVGSVNGSATSLADNREYGIFLHDIAEVKKLEGFMNQDFKDPAGETWQDSIACKHDPKPAPQGNDGKI